MTTLRELALNPERRAKAKAWQAELQQRFGPSLSKHPAELQFVLGVDREQMITQQLTARASNPNHSELEPLDQRNDDFLHNSLAEGLSYQGRFREAAAITRSPDHAREYLEKADALDSMGAQCDCPETVVFPSARDAKGEHVPARVKVEGVFDGQNHIALTRCLHCQGLVATTE